MSHKLPSIVIEIIIKALNEGILIQKQARLCDLAGLDFIPTEILPYLKLHHQKTIAKSPCNFSENTNKINSICSSKLSN